MNRSYLFFIIISLVLLITAFGCEDVIDVELEEGSSFVVVDAWINDLPEDQVIQLNLSQPYFDNTTPDGIENAEVKITRQDGMEFNFIHTTNGRYVWNYEGSPLGVPGNSFDLSISFNGQSYTSSTSIFRVPTVDSIGVELRENELFFDDGLYAQFFARDFSGLGDTYWIKTYRNGSYLSKSQELNIAYDAGFDAGTGVDGLIFIPPIRELVNPLNEDLIPTPYDTGDVIRVEIHSMSIEAFQFLEIARDQINNGDNGIFSIPLANTRTNIVAGGEQPVLGFFNIAGVSSLEKEILGAD